MSASFPNASNVTSFEGLPVDVTDDSRILPISSLVCSGSCLLYQDTGDFESVHHYGRGKASDVLVEYGYFDTTGRDSHLIGLVGRLV